MAAALPSSFDPDDGLSSASDGNVRQETLSDDRVDGLAGRTRGRKRRSHSCY